MTTFLSLAFTVLTGTVAGDGAALTGRITVDLRYRHGDLEVAYQVACQANKTCTLSSLAGANRSWHVAVTPALRPNGILSIKTVVHEQGREVSRSEIQTKKGEEVRLVSADESEDHTELVLKAY
jgi:hypothetical protein